MPAGNGTGPLGMGPMTGRAAGYCAGFGVPGYVNPTMGRGFGAGPGAFAPAPYVGAGMPYGFPPPYASAWGRRLRGFRAGFGRGRGAGRGRGRFGR